MSMKRIKEQLEDLERAQTQSHYLESGGNVFPNPFENTIADLSEKINLLAKLLEQKMDSLMEEIRNK